MDSELRICDNPYRATSELYCLVRVETFRRVRTHTGWNAKLPFAFWKLYIGGIRGELNLYLARAILRNLGIHTQRLCEREEFSMW